MKKFKIFGVVRVDESAGMLGLSPSIRHVNDQNDCGSFFGAMIIRQDSGR